MIGYLHDWNSMQFVPNVAVWWYAGSWMANEEFFCFWQISDVLVPGQQDISAKEALLLWCRRTLEGYPDVRIRNFTNSWRDGKAFLSIIHRHRSVTLCAFLSWSLIKLRQHPVIVKLKVEVFIVMRFHWKLAVRNGISCRARCTLWKPSTKKQVLYISATVQVFCFQKCAIRIFAKILSSIVTCTMLLFTSITSGLMHVLTGTEGTFCAYTGIHPCSLFGRHSHMLV